MSRVLIIAFLLFHGQLLAQNNPARPNFNPAPVYFQENKGQFTDGDGQPVPQVLFRQSAPGMDLYITEQGLTYSFVQWKKIPKIHPAEADIQGEARTGKKKMQKIYDWNRADMTLAGADIRRENIVREKMNEAPSRFFLGHCPDGVGDVYGYERITVRNVYPFIDWVLYNASGKGVKYDFVLHPGADPSRIQMIYRSEQALKKEADGSLQLTTNLGSLKEEAPFTYWISSGKEVSSAFSVQVRELEDGGHESTVKFILDEIKTPVETKMVIDPQLYWSTFFGGSGFDGPRCTDVDANGNVYVTGYTESTNFPMQSSGTFYQGTFGGGTRDLFLQKFNNNGVRLWATYYGGNQTDEGWHMDFDASNNLFLIGYSESPNFPTQNAGTFFQGTYGGQGDAIILKFDSNGNRLWATYYGGAQMEEGFGITTDPSGNIFLTGETRSNTTFPLLNAGTFYQGTYGTGTSDAFILKFDNAGNRLWATYAGGWNTDMGNSITTDASGNVFVTGYAWGGGFPLQNAGTFYQGSITGSGDIFIMKFTNTGALLWSTYYGGGAVDEGNSIVTDAQGNIFITGSTASSAASFPLFNPGGGAYYQGTKGGTWDTYMLKFDNSGNRLWATYFGGAGDETSKEYTFDNLVVDACGNVYMSVETTSPGMPVLQACDGGYYDNSFNGGTYDLFITQFSNSGVQLWGSFIGGDGDDFRSPIGIDRSSSLFMSGEWTDNSPLTPATYPTVNPGGGAYSTSFSGGHDGFISKFMRTAPTVSVTAVNASCGCTGTATANPAGICSPYSYQWSNGQTTQTATGLCAGTFTVSVYNSVCGLVTGTVAVTAASSFTASTSSTPAVCLSANGSATVTPTGGSAPFTYSWSPSGGTNAVATGLAAGNYSITIIDASTCTVVATVSVTSAGSFTASVASSSAACLSANGSATITPTGGTSPYTYTWSPAGGTSSVATGLLSGTYTVSIQDANSCSYTATVSISQSGGPALALSGSSNVLCFGGNSGTASVSASGGTAPYTYSWNNGPTTSAVTGLAAGNYTATVTDANGCTQTQTVSITQPAALTSTASVSSTACGTPTGTASVTVSGGTPAYTYLWSNGGTGSQITGLSAQGYSVVISDANGCTSTQSVTVVQPGAPTLTITSTNPNCCLPTGMATALVSGGTPGYNYIWSPTGATTSAATGLFAGSYSVVVTDGNGCTATSSVILNVPASPTVSLASQTNPSCAGGQNGSASVSVNGGLAPFTYSWSPSGGTNAIATGLSAGNYSVQVQDANCCTAIYAINVTQPTALGQLITSTPASCGLNNGTAVVTASGGSPGYSYNWSNGATAAQISGLASQNYFVTIVDANGCTTSATVSVGSTTGPTADAGIGATILSGSSAPLLGSGGSSYSWIPSAGLSCDTCINPIASPSATTTYTLIVSDAGGCTDIDLVTIIVEEPCEGKPGEELFYLPNAFSPNDDGENDEICLLGRYDCLQEFTIYIFNRWGEEVFSSESKTFCWDGRYLEKPLNTGVYVYTLKTVLLNGEKLTRKGNITLAR